MKEFQTENTKFQGQLGARLYFRGSFPEQRLVRLPVVPIFPRYSIASETRARVEGTPREKAFLAWGDFQARSSFARSTIPE